MWVGSHFPVVDWRLERVMTGELDGLERATGEGEFGTSLFGL